jgi:peptide-methionine (R)-S-oxide reductase
VKISGWRIVSVSSNRSIRSVKTVTAAGLLFAETCRIRFSQKGHLKGSRKLIDKIEKTEEEWRRELSPEQYRVLREAGTERAFTGAYWDNHEKGAYYCAACHLKLFDSDTKFDSGSGWPSFYAPSSTDNVVLLTDNTMGMVRTEVRCKRCGSHLGHVFHDGPRPSGLRYCMNSLALKFEDE